jgi:hypothetical protein
MLMRLRVLSTGVTENDCMTEKLGQSNLDVHEHTA